MSMHFFVACLLGAASARHLQNGNLQVDLGDLPMQNPDLFGGDMLGVDIVDRHIVRGLNFRWKDNEIPYVIAPNIAEYKDLILSAMDEYHNRTCLRFVPRNYDSNFVYMYAGIGCYSHVGMLGGGQELSLGQGCMYKNIIIHELGHVVGFYHEQNRSDRDDYLIIYWDNIKRGMELQFFRLKSWQELILGPFDYDSIMLYDNMSFSKDGESFTMEARNGIPLLKTTEKAGLSKGDVTRINKMYDCKM